MARAAAITAGVLGGAVAAVAALWATIWLLWVGRERWFETPTGEDLQYFGLMMYLGMAGLFLPLPAAIVGGAVGGRWAARHAEPVAAADGGPRAGRRC